MRSRERQSKDQALSALNDALAFFLIQLDVTPGRMSEILRTSFVKAGATISRRKTSGRPHIARIAAVTGLTRQEVKRIIKSKFKIDSTRGDQESRVSRVVRAWRESQKYSKWASERPLRISGAYPSFESLCKEHSGDIPHMAVVAELKTRGMVRITQLRGREYIVLNKRSQTANRKGMDTLQFVTNLLDSVVRDDRVLLKKTQHVSVPSNLAPAYFERSVAARVSALVEQLQIDPAPLGRRRLSKGGLDVFAVVSRRGLGKKS